MFWLSLQCLLCCPRPVLAEAVRPSEPLLFGLGFVALGLMLVWDAANELRLRLQRRKWVEVPASVARARRGYVAEFDFNGESRRLALQPERSQPKYSPRYLFARAKRARADKGVWRARILVEPVSGRRVAWTRGRYGKGVALWSGVGGLVFVGAGVYILVAPWGAL